MQIRGLRHIVLGMVLCLSVVGCSHKSKYGRNGADGYGAATQGAGEGAGFAGDEAHDLLAKRKIYFDYDRSELRQGEYETVAAHADYLRQNPNRHVRIEGHTDESGSREYNVALGERRARTVAEALMAQGVSRHQIATVSFGKEKPDSMGHTAEAHALNRRAVIVYED
ncbi:MAG: peptidoglycan-associated lipoprotein [Gammaproteobacteria bacterium 39-13]|nr:peptidoglycan-associated lipoprotein Pal [Gammaproteobacteria bacterium]OJV90314.1 MAG: peptidoglycan-associated lipoprotein [Gammaproteobacteria bacterium 39-13]